MFEHLKLLCEVLFFAFDVFVCCCCPSIISVFNVSIWNVGNWKQIDNNRFQVNEQDSSGLTQQIANNYILASISKERVNTADNTIEPMVAISKKLFESYYSNAFEFNCKSYHANCIFRNFPHFPWNSIKKAFISISIHLPFVLLRPFSKLNESNCMLSHSIIYYRCFSLDPFSTSSLLIEMLNTQLNFWITMLTHTITHVPFRIDFIHRLCWKTRQTNSSKN